MAQGTEDFNDAHGAFDDGERWPGEAPSAAVARVVVRVDEAITLKRRTAAAWMTAHGDAIPTLPIKPSRLELAVVIALAETYGASLYQDARFLPMLDFIAERGAVTLVQRVMYGETRATEGNVPTWRQVENKRLAELLRAARVPFEFLCGTWPGVFMAQAHGVLQGFMKQPPMAPPLPPEPPMESEDGERDDG